MTNTKVIKALNAQDYTGSYEIFGDEYKISSSLLMQMVNNITFLNARKNGENFRYNFDEIQDTEELTEIVDTIKAAVEAKLAA